VTTTPGVDEAVLAAFVDAGWELASTVAGSVMVWEFVRSSKRVRVVQQRDGWVTVTVAGDGQLGAARRFRLGALPGVARQI